MEDSIKYLNIDDLIPGEFQAHFENIGDNIDDLANSISKHGIIVPLIVREKGIQQYEIILGNRRYSAAKKIGLKQVPAIIIKADDEKALDIIISENIQRRELTAKEEAYLYDRELEYANNNEKNLSDKLGIPIDRIISKLKFIKKNNDTSNKTIEKNIDNNTNNISNNSSINKDIINLSELNKEEREDLNMNNDIINNQNLNTDPTKTPAAQPAQEPTFGGRFFPSLEDEPTNMNLNQNVSAFSMPINNNSPQSLIDLTDTSVPNNDVSTTNINQPINNNSPQTINTNPIDIQQEQPAIPNLDALSTNIIDNNQYQANQQPTDYNNPPISNSNEMVQGMETNITSNEQLNNYNQVPQIPLDYPNNESSLDSLNNVDNYNQPIDLPTNNYEYVATNNNLDQITNNITDSNVNMINEDLNYNTSNNTTPTESKDILPVVNMIKSLAVNIENLGYKLNISEEENNESYSIKIEVEK